MIPLIDRLAELEHKQWVQWASKILETEPNISEQRKTRWKELIATPYQELSDEWKEYDKEYARRIIREIILTVDQDSIDEDL